MHYISRSACSQAAERTLERLNPRKPKTGAFPVLFDERIAAGFRFWYLDKDPALKNLWDNREFQSIIGDRIRLVEQQRNKLTGG